MLVLSYCQNYIFEHMTDKIFLVNPFGIRPPTAPKVKVLEPPLGV